jgi:hypothetical protein
VAIEIHQVDIVGDRPSTELGQGGARRADETAEPAPARPPQDTAALLRDWHREQAVRTARLRAD